MTHNADRTSDDGSTGSETATERDGATARQGDGATDQQRDGEADRRGDAATQRQGDADPEQIVDDLDVEGAGGRGSGWIHWDCPECGRTNDTPLTGFATVYNRVGAAGIRLGCAHPRCGYHAPLVEVQESIAYASTHREPWGGA